MPVKIKGASFANTHALRAAFSEATVAALLWDALKKIERLEHQASPTKPLQPQQEEN